MHFMGTSEGTRWGKLRGSRATSTLQRNFVGSARWTHETVVMISDDPGLERLSKFCNRILKGLSFESTLTLHRKPRPTLTLGLWLSHEIIAAHPGMPLSEAWGIIVDEPNRLGREDQHLRRILRADVAPHPSTLIRIGERLRTAPELQIDFIRLDRRARVRLLFRCLRRGRRFIWPDGACMGGA